jgi:hypothetical protein
MNQRPKASVVIFAKSVPNLASFYQAVADMVVDHAEKDYVVLELAELQVVIHSIPKAISDQIDLTVPPKLRDETPIKICLPVSSIEQARTRTSALGGGVEPRDKEWEARGFRACDAFDPEGNVFQVRESAA